MVLYFVVSVLGSLLFLISSVPSSLSCQLLQLALLLKLGLAPFQFWVYKVISNLQLSSLCFFLGPLKFGLLWLLVGINSPSLLLFSASLILGISLLWNGTVVSVILFASGARNIIFLVLLGPSYFPCFYATYLLALLGVALISARIISPFIAFACLAGLPPLTMFWAKVVALSLFPFFWALLLLLVSCLSLWPYLLCAICFPSSSSSSFLPVILLSLTPSLFLPATL